MDWASLIPIAVSALPGLMGGGAASAGTKELRRGQEEIRRVRIPTIQEITYDPELYTYLQDFTPEEIQALYTLGPSAFEQIVTDPSLRADRELAIAQARQRALSGFTAEDRAALEQYLQAAAAQAKSAQKQVLEEAQRRGTADSGAQLAAALQASQEAANMLSNQALQQAAMKMRQQQEATGQLANLAAALEQSDYARAAELAQRRDAIEQFNQQLRQSALATNVQARNVAGLRNLETKQKIAQQNVDLQNLAKEQRAKAPLTIAGLELDKASKIAGMAPGIAELTTKGRASEIAGYAQIAGGLANILGKTGGSNEEPAQLLGTFSKFGQSLIPGG